MKINIREELNNIDFNTYNQYDLLNMYESLDMSDEEKQELVKILANHEDPEVIGDYLSKKYYKQEFDDFDDRDMDDELKAYFKGFVDVEEKLCKDEMPKLKNEAKNVQVVDGKTVEFPRGIVAPEYLWTAVCNNKQEVVKKYFESGKEPNKRYPRMGHMNSLIMGALRNNNLEMVDILKSFGETILPEEQREYDKEMERLSESLFDIVDNEKEDGEWDVIATKYVEDSDGFYTDYTWYYNGKKHIFMFGDADIYTPDEDNADWEVEVYEGREKEAWDEAEEWFDAYKGFEDDDLDESIGTHSIKDKVNDFRSKYPKAIWFDNGKEIIVRETRENERRLKEFGLLDYALFDTYNDRDVYVIDYISNYETLSAKNRRDESLNDENSLDGLIDSAVDFYISKFRNSNVKDYFDKKAILELRNNLHIKFYVDDYIKDWERELRNTTKTNEEYLDNVQSYIDLLKKILYKLNSNESLKEGTNNSNGKYVVSLYEKYPLYQPAEGGYYYDGIELIEIHDGFETLDKAKEELVRWAKEEEFEYINDEYGYAKDEYKWKYIGEGQFMQIESNIDDDYDDVGSQESGRKIYEDTIKTENGKWVNKGKEGTHGTFRTKKEANAQRKAMFANGYKENIEEARSRKMRVYDKLDNLVGGLNESIGGFFKYKAWLRRNGLKDVEKSYYNYLEETDKTFRSMPEKSKEKQVRQMFPYRFAMVEGVEDKVEKETIRTPRGTFEIYQGTWKEFEKEDDREDWGLWFDHYTPDNVSWEETKKWYKIMHNHKNNHAMAILYKDLTK